MLEKFFEPKCIQSFSSSEPSEEESSQVEYSIALSEEDIVTIVSETGGYSASDLRQLCEEAAMNVTRELPLETLKTIKRSELRPIVLRDFERGWTRVRPSSSRDMQLSLKAWKEKFGTDG